MSTYVLKDEKSGTIDEIISIRATAGKVELEFDLAGQAGLTGGRMTVVFHAHDVTIFIKKLEAARNAAALMAAMGAP